MPSQKINIQRSSTIVTLADNAHTDVHTVRYNRDSCIANLASFNPATYLMDWCATKGVTEAISGGFFLSRSAEALGDFWLDGAQLPSASIPSPWNNVRGSLNIDAGGGLSLGARNSFPERPKNSLLQAGPLLVSNGVNQIINGKEKEGISATSEQFDSDITVGRYPRAALGTNAKYIWSVVCDGRSQQDAGLTLQELANFMFSLGAEYALNLDGGGSATQISEGALRNTPRDDSKDLHRGRPIHSAIIFSNNHS